MLFWLSLSTSTVIYLGLRPSRDPTFLIKNHLVNNNNELDFFLEKKTSGSERISGRHFSLSAELSTRGRYRAWRSKGSSFKKQQKSKAIMSIRPALQCLGLDLRSLLRPREQLISCWNGSIQVCFQWAFVLTRRQGRAFAGQGAGGAVSMSLSVSQIAMRCYGPKRGQIMARPCVGLRLIDHVPDISLHTRVVSLPCVADAECTD